MKKLAVVAAIFVSTLAFAQEAPKDGKMKPEHRREFADFTPKQMAELRTKRMTLALDLTEKQQKQVLKLNEGKAQKHKAALEEIKKRKTSGEKLPRLSANERFDMKSKRLDAQIAEKNQMKSILSDEQYQKWEAMKTERREQMKKHFKSRGGAHKMHKTLRK